jgi:hypothetical protein
LFLNFFPVDNGVIAPVMGDPIKADGKAEDNGRNVPGVSIFGQPGFPELSCVDHQLRHRFVL